MSDKETPLSVAILIALPEEHDTFCEFFPVKKDNSQDNYIILEHECKISDLKLFSILASDMGSDCATSSAYKICELIEPDIVACIGIAGALSDDCKVGDVCISNEILDVLHNAKVKDGVGPRKSQKISLSPRTYPVDTDILASARFLRSMPKYQTVYHDFINRCDDRKQKIFSENQEISNILSSETGTPTVCHVGSIVCGPVSASKTYNDQLKELNRKVLAIETESGGIFRVCRERHIPSITIRGISDRADNKKSALESIAKLNLRKLAMLNATDYFSILLNNEDFRKSCISAAQREQFRDISTKSIDAPKIISSCKKALESYLGDNSPEYKIRPENVSLPLPRIRKISLEDEITDLSEEEPLPVAEMLARNRRAMVKLPKSFPDRSFSWSVGLELLKEELDGKQILPIVLDGQWFSPPSRGIRKAIDFVYDEEIARNEFSRVIIISEPPFESSARMNFLIDEIKNYDPSGVLVITKAETPIEQIDRFRSLIGLVDCTPASVPFGEIACYLEEVFEMTPEHAEVAATRLNDTFSKFRLHTHPTYFIGLQESTISALINANQRGELIQLAVDGLLSFVVASDQSAVKLNRTTREEFLTDLAFEINFNKRTFRLADLIAFVDAFARNKFLEISPIEFIDSFRKVGLISEVSGNIQFSLSYLEAHLLSQRLKDSPDFAEKYFDPELPRFDYYTFDLYCEKGAHPAVVRRVMEYADATLALCGLDENAFVERLVKPHALSNVSLLIDRANKLADSLEKISANPDSAERRTEKQRLIDSREAVRAKVGTESRSQREHLSQEIRTDFARLDGLSRSTTLLATLIGSGAERLDGETKLGIGEKLLSVSERFAHYWVSDRLRIDFEAMRDEISSDQFIEGIIEEFDLFIDERESIRSDLMVFIDDQEMKFLSMPLGTILDRIASHAGVRSLKPVLQKIKPVNRAQEIIYGVWFMDVEPFTGRAVLRSALKKYKGSALLRLIVANHLMWRVFWHHWQLNSRTAFVNAARSTLRPMGLITAKEHEQKMLAGPKS